MKALLVKMSSLGDVVHALPGVTDAARRGARFHWVVEEAYQAIPASHPAVERVLPIAWRRWRRRIWRSRGEMQAFWRRLAGERYDLVIDSQGLLKSALVSSRAQAPEKVGFCRNSAREPAAARFYDRCVEVPVGKHAAERQRRLFAGALGYGCDVQSGIDFGLRQVAESLEGGVPRWDAKTGQATEAGRATKPGRRCIFLHGTSWATKLWPEPMWAELARLACSAGFDVVLPWGDQAERARAERIAASTGAALLPSGSLAQLMGELRQARLAVGVDSGLAHLAGALGTPTLVLYGSTSSALTGCRGASVYNLQADFGCSPCLSKTCRYRGPDSMWRGMRVVPPCYGELDPETVWAGALELLDANRVLHI